MILRFLHSSFAKGVLVLAGGTAAAQALGVLVAPVITRLYDPEHFAILAFYTSVLGILSAVSSLKYDVAIPLPGTNRASASLLVLSCVVVLFLATASSLVILAIQQFRSASPEHGLGFLVWLVPMGVLGTGLYSSFRYWAIRQEDFTSIAQTRMYQSVLQAVTQVVAGFFHPSPGGLILGHFFGEAGGVGILARRVLGRVPGQLASVTYRSVVAVMKRYLRFALLASGAGIVNSLGLYIAPILLLSLYGADVAGWFALADRMIAIPGSLIGAAVSQVYFGEVARLKRDPLRLKQIMFLRARYLTLVIVGPTLLLAVFGRPIFTFIFGAAWEPAGLYAQFLAIAMACSFIVAPVAQNLNVLERQDLSFFWSLGRLLLVCSSLVLPAVLGWPDASAVAAYAFAMSASYCLLFVVNNHAINCQIAE